MANCPTQPCTELVAGRCEDVDRLTQELAAEHRRVLELEAELERLRREHLQGSARGPNLKGERMAKHNGSGVYRNDQQMCWEAWAVNAKTGEEQLVGWLAYEAATPYTRGHWEENLWRRFLALEKKD